jgi:hypothetical protein
MLADVCVIRTNYSGTGSYAPLIFELIKTHRIRAVLEENIEYKK